MTAIDEFIINELPEISEELSVYLREQLFNLCKEYKIHSNVIIEEYHNLLIDNKRDCQKALDLLIVKCKTNQFDLPDTQTSVEKQNLIKKRITQPKTVETSKPYFKCKFFVKYKENYVWYGFDKNNKLQKLPFESRYCIKCGAISNDKQCCDCDTNPMFEARYNPIYPIGNGEFREVWKVPRTVYDCEEILKLNINKKELYERLLELTKLQSQL